MKNRRKTRTVMKGDVPVGSDHPISVQTMTKVDTADVEATDVTHPPNRGR